MTKKDKSTFKDFKIYYQYIRKLTSKTYFLDEADNMSYHKYV